jgi:hypothetical protein
MSHRVLAQAKLKVKLDNTTSSGKNYHTLASVVAAGTAAINIRKVCRPHRLAT